jgi:excisionase family DNA binding protein
MISYIPHQNAYHCAEAVACAAPKNNRTGCTRVLQMITNRACHKIARRVNCGRPEFLSLRIAVIEKIYSAAQAATLLGLHKKTLLKYTRQGRITYIRYPDGSRRFRESTLNHFLSSNTVPATRPLPTKRSRKGPTSYDDKRPRNNSQNP